MNLQDSLNKVAKATTTREALLDQLQLMGGPLLRSMVADVFSQTIIAERELARDVTAASAQRVLEIEALDIIHAGQADVSPLAPAHLRVLTRQVVQSTRDLNMAELGKTISSLDEPDYESTDTP